MCIRGGLTTRRCEHVDIRVVGRIFRNARADLQYKGVVIRAVLQAMTIGIAGPETGGITCSQHLGPGIGDQSYLTAQHVDKLVGGGLPMALA
jgi:hypothetical protein